MRTEAREDVEGSSGEAVSYEMMEGFDDEDEDEDEDENQNEGIAGWHYAVDGIEQVQGVGHSEVVASGFWRPNKLY